MIRTRARAETWDEVRSKASDTGEFDSLMNSADYLQYIKDRQE